MTTPQATRPGHTHGPTGTPGRTRPDATAPAAPPSGAGPVVDEEQLRADQGLGERVGRQLHPAPGQVERDLGLLRDAARRWIPHARTLLDTAATPAERQRWQARIQRADPCLPRPCTVSGVVELAGAVGDLLRAIRAARLAGLPGVRLADWIRASCARGDDGPFPPGFRIRTGTLERACGRSRQDVRDAVGALLADGFLERYGEGVFPPGSRALREARPAHIAARIRQQAAAGVHPAGRTLLPADSLARVFVVDLRPVRAAVRLLREQGFLTPDRLLRVTPDPPGTHPSGTAPPPAEPPAPLPHAEFTRVLHTTVRDWQYRTPGTPAALRARWALLQNIASTLLTTELPHADADRTPFVRAREAAGLPLPEGAWWALWQNACLAAALRPLLGLAPEPENHP
ncbi:hypothetical protein ACIQXD_33250 [Streptomyces uncialis]|uniref:hypothetical protein n=1 Tax=Streptomyces uncialis TaxID=1048205 RepID=UPI003819735D